MPMSIKINILSKIAHAGTGQELRGCLQALPGIARYRPAARYCPDEGVR